MPHWKTLFSYDHLGCHDLPDAGAGKWHDLVVKILKIERREVTGASGKKEMLAVADLDGGLKPMIINKTNFRILENLFGIGEYTVYEGKTVTLYAARVEGKGKKIVDGIRIRDVLPAKKKKELTPDSPRWGGAKQSLKDGNVTLEQLQSTFEISANNIKLLQDEN
jgi:hypothetical protein